MTAVLGTELVASTQLLLKKEGLKELLGGYSRRKRERERRKEEAKRLG